MALTDKLTAIANAIRAKTGGTASLTLDEMATAISDIQSGGGATEPYIEETYSGYTLKSAKMVGHKFVGISAFNGKSYMTKVIVPQSINAIYANAFYNCEQLETISIPDTVTKIDSNAFYRCLKLILNKLPKNLTTIGEYAFNYCKLISIKNIPATVTKIDTYAFRYCTGLTSITFKGKPNTISNCFGSCDNLTTINVPWAEGEVANAPWGATNATINYNYTGE